LGVETQAVAVVGDYLFDIDAGKTAGATTVLLTNGGPLPPYAHASDMTIDSLGELQRIVRLAQPLPAGKVPVDLLRHYLAEFTFQDPSVIVNPGIGEDTAAVDVGAEEVLILKSDPITFATDAIGRYAVLINANDIATSGADPRWFLATLLFPVGITGYQVLRVMREMKAFCERWAITLCGGHSEITDAVNRPVLAGTMAGTVARSRLIEKTAMRPGDGVLLTKGVAVEGTSIIAREFGMRLRDLGVSDDDIEAGRRFLDRISILEEAGIARDTEGVSALHDVTEGGVATALEELSIAGGHRIRVHMDRIPLLPLTHRLGRLLGIDPLGLIGSGSLLICCRPRSCARLRERIQKVGIAVTPIGEVLAKGAGIEAVTDEGPAVWPRFEVDEITRLFDASG
jgi:hydrogenase maturation factor